jgi:hypothetical protein
LPRFTRLRSQQAFEQGEKHTSTCSTRPDLARARPAPDPARPAPRQAKPVPLPVSAPIKPAEASTVCPARSRPHRSARSPAFALHKACQRPPSTHHHRPTNRAFPSLVRPSRETLHASVKLPERGIELCLAGDTGSRSPDFTRPSASVDRAPR